jgi:N-glycosylase/DNA lyase
MELKVKNFNLKDTITCGQIFRYEEELDNSYTVILSDRVINIKQDNDIITFNSNKEDNLKEVIINYFDLEYDYDSINNMLLKSNPELKDIINYSKGLKMINEPKLEVIISYILSQNNRVPQIKKSLDNISKEAGEKVIFNNKEYYLFPTIDNLKKLSIDDFRRLKCGFRDKYLYNFIQSNFDINKIEKLPSKEALDLLISMKGIGEKVASCILLFGYHRFDVYPIDTWVKKYMKDEYNITTIKGIKSFCLERYKEYTGLVIQYMFNYKRNKD